MHIHIEPKPLVHVYVCTTENLEFGRADLHMKLEDTTAEEVVKLIQDTIFKKISEKVKGLAKKITE